MPLNASARGVAAGDYHSCALLENGTVSCWGRNNAGQLGYGHTEAIGDDEAADAAGPVALGGLAVQVVAGGEHNCALLDSGKVRCWGYGLYGELGYGNTAIVGDNETPASVGDVSLGELAVEVAAGQYHTCAVLVSGAVRCWGYGYRGALGSGSTQSIGNDELPSDVPAVPLDAAATALATGYNHTCAILDRGSVHCWGFGGNGQLGLGTTTTLGDNEPVASAGSVDLAGARAFSIAAGQAHTCAVLSGSVTCWGANGRGQLGLGHVDAIGDNESPIVGGPTLVLSP